MRQGAAGGHPGSLRQPAAAGGGRWGRATGRTAVGTHWLLHVNAASGKDLAVPLEVHHAGALKPSFSSLLTLAGGGALAAAHRIPRPGPAGQWGQPERLSLCRRTLRGDGAGAQAAPVQMMLRAVCCIGSSCLLCLAYDWLPPTRFCACRQATQLHVGQRSVCACVCFYKASYIKQRGCEGGRGAQVQHAFAGGKNEGERGAGNGEQQIAEVTSAGRGAESAGATG